MLLWLTQGIPDFNINEFVDLTFDAPTSPWSVRVVKLDIITWVFGLLAFKICSMSFRFATTCFGVRGGVSRVWVSLPDFGNRSFVPQWRKIASGFLRAIAWLKTSISAVFPPGKLCVVTLYPLRLILKPSRFFTIESPSMIMCFLGFLFCEVLFCVDFSCADFPLALAVPILSSL